MILLTTTPGKKGWPQMDLIKSQMSISASFAIPFLVAYGKKVCHRCTDLKDKRLGR
jgi:hypothetical protein